MRFKNFKNKEKVSFVVYADMESVLKPIFEKKDKYQEHMPAAIGYYVKCSYDPSLSYYHSFCDEDCMQCFAGQMGQFAENVETVFLCPYSNNMTPEQEVEFWKAAHCYIFEQPFGPNDLKARDYFHLSPTNNNRGEVTTNYREAAHEGFNINYKNGVVISVIFHNISGYDTHFIIKNIVSDTDARVDLLPVTKENTFSSLNILIKI